MGVLKVVVSHNVSLKQLIYQQKKIKNKKIQEEKSYVPVVSEALIGEEKISGEFFSSFLLSFDVFFLLVLENTKMCFSFYFCNIHLMLVSIRNRERNGK